MRSAHKKSQFEKQAQKAIKNISKGKQLVGQRKILIEDLNTITTLSIEARAERAGHKKTN